MGTRLLSSSVPARPLACRDRVARRRQTAALPAPAPPALPRALRQPSWHTVGLQAAARRAVRVRAGEGDVGEAPPAPAAPWGDDEEVYYEGTGAKNELYLSMALGIFVLWLPLTLADIGRYLWIKYRFTNKRVSVIVDSPIRQFQQDIAYSEVKSVVTIPRLFGLWGDMVLKLKGGQTVQISCLEADEYERIRDYIRTKID